MFVWDGDRSVVGWAQGMSVSKVGLKQRAEGEVEVEVVGIVIVVVVDECGMGEERVALVLVLMLVVVAVIVDLGVGKREGGVLIVVDGKLSVDVFVTRTVVPEDMLVAGGDDSGREG